MAKRKAVVSVRECVACGCCVKVCPRNAITVPKGISAEIDESLCVGCGKCAGADCRYTRQESFIFPSPVWNLSKEIRRSSLAKPSSGF